MSKSERIHFESDRNLLPKIDALKAYQPTGDLISDIKRFWEIQGVTNEMAGEKLQAAVENGDEQALYSHLTNVVESPIPNQGGHQQTWDLYNYMTARRDLAQRIQTAYIVKKGHS